MERTESARLVGVISAAFPGKTISEETVRVYHGLLEDLDAPLAAEAVKEVLKAARWWPTVAEIREMYDQLGAERKRRHAIAPEWLPEISEAERQENLVRIREYAAKIGIGRAA